MRIGIDTHAAEQPGSGNCTYIRNLIRALLSIGADHEYVFYVIDRTHRFYEGLPKLSNVRLRELAIRHPLLRIPFGLGPATFRDSLDVLHVQYIAPPFFRGKGIATIHDLAFLHVPRTFSRFFVWRSKILVRRTARTAARVITGYGHSKKDIVRTYGLEEDRVDIVPCGVDPDLFRAAEPGQLKILLTKYGIRQPYILAVGRLNPRKNMVSLARAFKKARFEHGLPHQLVIAGKSDFKAAEIAGAIRDIERRDIVLPGFVPDEDLPALYSGAEMFVYPSLFEGFGLPVLEAMAAGVPIIASDTSSIPEILGDAGLAVDPADEDALSAAIVRLAHDEALREDCRRKGRERSRQFTWEAAARKLLKIYEDVGREP
jgi:glycosyltransferase involved in cell wall biosynthesis